jgi:DNA-binding MarR family transcriptional regulator
MTEKILWGVLETASDVFADVKETLKEWELTSTSYRILAAINDNPGIAPKDVRVLLGGFSDMTRLIDRLERLGYVQRKKAHSDRRGQKLVFTVAGIEAFEAARDALGKHGPKIAKSALCAIEKLSNEVSA